MPSFAYVWTTSVPWNDQGVKRGLNMERRVSLPAVIIC